MKTQWKVIPELSDHANALIQHFGHFYAKPLAANDFSGAASALALFGPAIAAAGLYQRFWWGLPMGIVSYFLMIRVAGIFNPTQFFRDDAHRTAHEEVMAYADLRRSEQRSPFAQDE